MSAQTIVIAEDDGAIRDLVTHHLEREGFGVLGAADGQAALRHARAAADLLILDVGLPVIDGYDVARTLRREQRDLPIIMLTAHTDEIDRVVGFELGADDYVCKPFSPRELVARVKAILRRSGLPQQHVPAPLRFGRMEIDERAREVRIDGMDVRLKPREFELLVELASNPGVAFSRERLLQKVWGFDFCGDARTVDVHVHRLRSKLGSFAMPQVVCTVYGLGYKFAQCDART
ncbi:MAG: response regulator transcription factor [Candidatus Eremiobacteraeota bacterium]|nr:response regulator transcription factor [Candidatus Eremiobacteraeota bacterium]MBV8374287.1 response regulator transcription factor [Candidatus Eremiobacteraeota bacterium]